MKRAMAFLVLAACATSLGCSSSADDAGASYANETPANAGRDLSGGSEPAGPAVPSGGTSSGTPTTTTNEIPGGEQQAGVLTAGVWDDNLNFDFFGKYVTAWSGNRIFSQAERDAAHARASQRSAKTELDVAIVLDTTSSMGDEIKYLQKELDSIVQTLKVKFPQTTPRFGLVVYRDHGDDYLAQSTEFTDDVASFRAVLAQQSAAGGGDIPEAVPEGLTSGVGLGWRTSGDVARVMFWVADAPQHLGEEQAVHTAVMSAVDKGIHIYPVASSGTDPSAELTMRAAAQITSGRYVFLTDDSGIGNPHAEPHIPCYVVTPLQGAIVRMVESEMRGVRVEPAATDVIRTVGSPVDGKCNLQNQTQVILY